MLAIIGGAMGITFCLCVIFFSYKSYKTKIALNQSAIDKVFECQKTIYKCKETITNILGDPRVSNNTKKRIKEALVWNQY